MFKELFGDIGKELKAMRDELKLGPRTRTITVAKPYCSPARPIITGTFQQYGVKLYGYNEYTHRVNVLQWLRQQGLQADGVSEAMERTAPTATIAEVTVSEQAAAWAEYLLLRTGKLYVPGQYVNQRNADWAAKHAGRMPPAWQNGQPWLEKSCSATQDWQALQNAVRRQSTPTNSRTNVRQLTKQKGRRR